MVRLIKTVDDIKAYEEKLPVLADPRFLQTKSDEFGWFVSEKLLLPFYLKTKLGINRAFVTMGFVYLDDTVSADEEQQFYTEMAGLCKKSKIYIVETAYTNTIFKTCPKGAGHAILGTHLINLKQEEEQLFKNLHSKHRNVIRKALKEGVTVKYGPVYREVCMDLIGATFRRQGKVWSDTKELYYLEQALGSNIRFYVAEKEGSPQGCAVVLWNKERGYYLYGGSTERPFTGSVNLLQWQIILDLKKEGVKEYDFFGARVDPDKNSKIEGIQRFKERFGGTLVTGYKWKLPVHKPMYFLYLAVFFVYNLLKGKVYKGDLIDIEKRRMRKKKR